MQKILNQEGNVHFSLTQRDKLDRNHIDSIVEIGAHFPFGNQLF